VGPDPGIIKTTGAPEPSGNSIVPFSGPFGPAASTKISCGEGAAAVTLTAIKSAAAIRIVLILPRTLRSAQFKAKLIAPINQEQLFSTDLAFHSADNHMAASETA